MVRRLLVIFLRPQPWILAAYRQVAWNLKVLQNARWGPLLAEIGCNYWG